MSPDMRIDSLKTDTEAPENLPVSALAFLGDGVYGLMVREYLTQQSGGKADKLHESNIRMVNASYQAAASKILMPYLTPEESGIFIRGRNTHTAHTPRNQSKSDYHAATGLETLFGWLYINGKTDRLKELFARIVSQ